MNKSKKRDRANVSDANNDIGVIRDDITGFDNAEFRVDN